MDFKKGITGGLIAGVVFLVFESLYALIAAGNLFGPLAMMASIPMQTPPPQIGLGSAIFVGLITHAILSIGFGLVVTFLIDKVDALRSSTATLLVVTSAFGLVLWLVNFYVLSGILGTPWFATAPSALWQGFIAHTFFFGTVLGGYLTSQLPQQQQSPTAPQQG